VRLYAWPVCSALRHVQTYRILVGGQEPLGETERQQFANHSLDARSVTASASSLTKALVAFPPGLRVAEPADEPGGPPKRFERVTRVPERRGVVRDGLRVALGPSDNAGVAEQYPKFDIAELSVLAEVPLMETFDVVQPVLERSLDALSFQMQTALHVIALEMLDVTPPLHVGEKREWQAHTPADTAVSPKFGQQPAALSWNEYPVDIPDLQKGPLPADAKQRMALWWYIKGLDAPYAVDKFMCLWTSLEILWSTSDVKVEAAYTTSCGHVVKSCPTCGSPVSKTVRGPSIKRFLTEQADVQAADAANLWNFRQVVHGKNVFGGQQLDLGVLTSLLRAAVLRLLKLSLGDPLDQKPLLVQAGGLAVGNRMVMSGERPVNDRDTAIVEFLQTLST